MDDFDVSVIELDDDSLSVRKWALCFVADYIFDGATAAEHVAAALVIEDYLIGDAVEDEDLADE